METRALATQKLNAVFKTPDNEISQRNLTWYGIIVEAPINRILILILQAHTGTGPTSETYDCS